MRESVTRLPRFGKEIVMQAKMMSVPYTFKIPMELLGGLEAITLRQSLDKLIDTNVHHLTLDMRNVRAINGPGLRFLADLYLSLYKMDGSLRLIHVSSKMAGLLNSVGLSPTIALEEENSVGNAHLAIDNRPTAAPRCLAFR